MSLSLYWEPAERKKKSLPDALKYVLRKRNGDMTVHSLQLDETDIPYLEGLRDAGIDGATELMEAIRKHGAVIVNEE